MNLTVDNVRELSGQDCRTLKTLNLSNKDIVHVHDLSPCLELHRLNLSRNRLSNFKGISDVYTLTWLDLSHNQIQSLTAVRILYNLRMLKASNNNITSCGDLSQLTGLLALILNNNQLTTLTGLNKLSQLNTLVLSNNCFDDINIQGLIQLNKLSLSHNSLREIPNTQSNYDLVEMRLNGNKITKLPQTIQNNTKLKILDIGNNRIAAIRDIKILKDVKNLRSVNMKGNPICVNKEYNIKVKEMLPTLSILDSIKITNTTDTNNRITNTTDSGTGCVKRIKTKKQLSILPTEQGNTSHSNKTLILLEEEGTSTIPEEEGTSRVPKEEGTSRVPEEDINVSDNTILNYKEQATVQTNKHIKRPRGQSGVVCVRHVKKRKREKSVLVTMATEVPAIGEGTMSSWD